MICVFASGNGSNFQVIAEHFPGKVKLVCNKKNALVLERAKKLKVPYKIIEHSKFPTRESHEEKLLLELNKWEKKWDAFVLAGYMRVLSPQFFKLKEKYFPQTKIINLHPAHLADYKGAHAYEFAHEGKHHSWGLTVHEVTELLDNGPIIKSDSFSIFPWESVEAIKSRVQIQEHKLIVEGIKTLIGEK